MVVEESGWSSMVVEVVQVEAGNTDGQSAGGDGVASSITGSSFLEVVVAVEVLIVRQWYQVVLMVVEDKVVQESDGPTVGGPGTANTGGGGGGGPGWSRYLEMVEMVVQVLLF